MDVIKSLYTGSFAKGSSPSEKVVCIIAPLPNCFLAARITPAELNNSVAPSFRVASYTGKSFDSTLLFVKALIFSGDIDRARLQ